jgi:hypothetical protein
MPTQVDESDVGTDRIWSDPTIRRNPIGIRVTESDRIRRTHFFVRFRRTSRRNLTESDGIRQKMCPSDSIGFRNPDSDRILQDTIGFVKFI